MPRAGKSERGRQTRAKIVDAATRVFQERGYLEATMAAIAAEAGVSVQTLYLAFGSKVAILEAVHDRAVVGDEEPLPVLDRPWVAGIRAEPDGMRALTVLVERALLIIERVSPIYGVMQAAAADAEVREFLDRTKAQRLDTLRVLSGELARKPGHTPNMPRQQAADILYALVSDDLHRLLVLERQWPRERWRRWVLQTAAQWLFPAALLPRAEPT